MPTPRKLIKAREEGQVAYSIELVTAALLAAGLCSLAAMGPFLYNAIIDLSRWCLGTRAQRAARIDC